jgi:hypothetical protein
VIVVLIIFFSLRSFIIPLDTIFQKNHFIDFTEIYLHFKLKLDSNFIKLLQKFSNILNVSFI